MAGSGHYTITFTNPAYGAAVYQLNKAGLIECPAGARGYSATEVFGHASVFQIRATIDDETTPPSVELPDNFYVGGLCDTTERRMCQETNKLTDVPIRQWTMGRIYAPAK